MFIIAVVLIHFSLIKTKTLFRFSTHLKLLLLTFPLLLIQCNLPVFYKLAGSSIVDGYTSQFSVFPGDTIQFFLNGRSTERRTLNIYDLNGNVVDRINVNLFQQKMQSNAPYQNGFAY